MGKTENSITCAAATSRQDDDGEIALLSSQGIENIDSLEGHEAKKQDSESQFGAPDEHQAIVSAIEHLRSTPTGQRCSAEQLEDLAIDLYNRICQGIQNGKISATQLQQAAKIFNQRPEELQQQARNAAN